MLGITTLNKVKIVNFFFPSKKKRLFLIYFTLNYTNICHVIRCQQLFLIKKILENKGLKSPTLLQENKHPKNVTFREEISKA